MSQKPADGEALRELRRLLAEQRTMEERHRKERESISRDIDALIGISADTRPRRPRLTHEQLRQISGV